MVVVVPKNVELDLCFVLCEVEDLDSLEGLLNRRGGLARLIGNVGDISFVVGDRRCHLRHFPEAVLQEVEEGLFRLAALQDFVDKQLIKGIVSLCLVLADLVEHLIGFLLPEVDIEVVVDDLNLNVGLVLDLY